jgi:hypothetical protein
METQAHAEGPQYKGLVAQLTGTIDDSSIFFKVRISGNTFFVAALSFRSQLTPLAYVPIGNNIYPLPSFLRMYLKNN